MMLKPFSGASGGTKDKEVRDNDFPEPTISILLLMMLIINYAETYP